MPKRSQPSTSSSGASANKRPRVNNSDSVTQSTSGASQNESEISAGKIVHIALKNFMCHASFKLDFNPRMNFILGHNGSGKSAILTATILGLGGSAKSTNRANTISKLVKTGESSATIEIHLSNSGPDAFERETFGDRIIVVRTILERGGGTYKILDERREVISKSKSKLDLILRFFEISVNNPITVLTQDCARTFLRDSDSRARFKLFKKGSGLEVIEEEINTCKQQNKDIEMHLKRRQEKSKYYISEYRERSKIYELLESAERAKERIVKLEHEGKWVAIREEECVLEGHEKELQKRVGKLQKYSDEVQSIDKKKQACEDAIGKLNAETSKLEERASQESSLITSKKQEMQEKKNEFFAVRKQFQGQDSKVKQCHEDIRQLEENLREVTQQDAREQSEQEIAELQQEKEGVEAEIFSRGQQMKEVQEQIAELDGKVYTLNSTKSGLSRTVANCREKMNQIRDETDNLAVYGAHIPQFLKALERNKGRFSQMPIGPIGRFLEVPDQRYRGVIEQLVVSQLSTFIVNTPADNETFLKLFAKECPNARCPSVIQRTFRHQVYDTSQFGVHVPKNTTSALEQLRCENPVVLNTLIDMVRLEQILICDSMAVGRKLTEHVENVPRNLKRIVVMDPLCEVYPQPNFRIYSWTPKRCNFIQVSAAEKRSHLKEQFEEAQQKFEEAKQAHEYAESSSLELKQRRKQLHTQLQALDRQKRDINTKIDDIKDQLGPHVEEDILLQEKRCLEDRLAELTEVHAPLKLKFDGVIAALEAMGTEIKELEERKEACETALNDLRNKADEIRQKKEQVMMDRLDKGTVLQEMEQRVTTQRADVEQQKSKVAGMVEVAGERVRTRKTKEEIRERIATLNAQRQVSTQIKETREEVMAELTLLEGKIEELDAEHELGQQTLRVQVEALENHTRAYENRKLVVQRRMSERFREILAQQSYHGDLKISYQKSTLDLEINPRQGGTVQGTKSLSGGERSFSTVAFLLSIWSCIEHPFFLLDEYDVFTDGSNRELMTKILMQEAMAKPNNQYMFLTPQDVSHLIEPSVELTVFKMPAKN